MRKRIYWSTLITVTVALTVFGLIGTVAASLWYTHLMTEQLRTDATFIGSQLLSADSDYPKLAVSISRDLTAGGNDIRITFIDKDGKVLGDSSADWNTMELHYNRPEVQAALQNGWGTSQRYSTTLRVNMLYVAIYDSSSQMFVRLALPLYAVQEIYWLFAAFILGSLVILLAVAAYIANRTSRLLSQPIHFLVSMANDIAAGNYKITALKASDPEFLELSNGLMRLASDLNAHVSALENSNTQLTTVLASISEGLIALDGEGKLLFINNAACMMLGLDNFDEVIGRKAADVLPSRTVVDLAINCLRDRRTVSAEASLPCGNLLVQTTASPMLAPSSGCILLLMDITHLRKLENMRHDFVANVTHELRTPLTSIRGYVETLQSGALANAELSAKFLQIIEIESERLSNLINDLLYLSEIENASQDTGIQRFRLADTASSVKEMLEYAASARGVSLESNISEDIFIEANPDRIKQLLLNLADNAVKYNQVGGSVLISAIKTHGLARISVKDTGIGISEQHISRIFERFYRVDKGRSRSIGGTGLGLSIVKHIVDLYRGNIRLISEAGKGSEFIIELPLRIEAKKKI